MLTAVFAVLERYPSICLTCNFDMVAVTEPCMGAGFEPTNSSVVSFGRELLCNSHIDHQTWRRPLTEPGDLDDEREAPERHVGDSSGAEVDRGHPDGRG